MGAEIIAPILTKFYNASLTNKIVISDWKVSKVTPIYKGKGNKEEAGNYRPISLIGHILLLLNACGRVADVMIFTFVSLMPVHNVCRICKVIKE